MIFFWLFYLQWILTTSLMSLWWVWWVSGDECVPYYALQLSHFLNAVCNTRPVWCHLARKLLLRNRPLFLLSFQDPETLQFEDLKRATLYSYKREKFWTQGHLILSRHPTPVPLCITRMKYIYVVKKFCSRYLLLQDRNGYIVVLDAIRNTCILRMDRPLQLICVKREYREKSLYCIIGKLAGPV